MFFYLRVLSNCLTHLNKRTGINKVALYTIQLEQKCVCCAQFRSVLDRVRLNVAFSVCIK